jgi:histidinol-phosphate phosphatase family protein
MKKALFIDRDGTINKDCPYCNDISQLEIYPDIIGIMNEYQKNNYIIVIITNQSGIGRGYFTLSQFQEYQ